ncbi:TetR/AcrR family transcriptional regulator [Actinopolyspora erythraea]|uniref:Branched-chain amino acid aminotransferase n=1 Tax=Actinopolyspora erythraea TaxID=414996 RepID=A0A099D6G3_9ACTN|nr:ScbR family autoregulator-binding transcription factor [Actinopolyspora erythraea]ASU78671.1 TetR/AcrR family transcriptional regulator [Actinopolyspora erythraea]KGI81427.1 branched-chain amino acid aminotransferase [Actinopolyspora erythraea]
MAQPKQERALHTRSQIIRAAAEVFNEYNFAEASLSKIVSRAGVTMGAIYFHFSSKEELAKAVMSEQAADVPLPHGEDGLQKLIDITIDMAHQLQHNVLLRAGVRLAVEQGAFGVTDDAAYVLWIERLREQLVAASERGELLPTIEVDEFARVLVGAYTGTQLLSQITTGHTDLPERITNLWRYLLPGVAAPGVISQLRLGPRTAEQEL